MLGLGVFLERRPLKLFNRAIVVIKRINSYVVSRFDYEFACTDTKLLCCLRTRIWGLRTLLYKKKPSYIDKKIEQISTKIASRYNHRQLAF